MTAFPNGAAPGAPGTKAIRQWKGGLVANSKRATCNWSTAHYPTMATPWPTPTPALDIACSAGECCQDYIIAPLQLDDHGLLRGRGPCLRAPDSALSVPSLETFWLFYVFFCLIRLGVLSLHREHATATFRHRLPFDPDPAKLDNIAQPSITITHPWHAACSHLSERSRRRTTQPARHTQNRNRNRAGLRPDLVRRIESGTARQTAHNPGRPPLAAL